MEVLDNLPHDRVVREAVGKPWAQTAVLPAGDPHVPHGMTHSIFARPFSQLLNGLFSTILRYLVPGLETCNSCYSQL